MLFNSRVHQTQRSSLPHFHNCAEKILFLIRRTVVIREGKKKFQEKSKAMNHTLPKRKKKKKALLIYAFDCEFKRPENMCSS